MDELAKRFASLAEQYGPQVRDIALQTAQIEAFRVLETIGMTTLCGLVLFRLGKWALKKEPESYCDAFDPTVCGYILCSLAGISWAIGLSLALDPGTWYALWHPEYLIAKRVLEL